MMVMSGIEVSLYAYRIIDDFIHHTSTTILTKPKSLSLFSAASRRFMLRSGTGLELGRRMDIPPVPPPISFHGFDPSVLLDHHLLDHDR